MRQTEILYLLVFSPDGHNCPSGTTLELLLNLPGECRDPRTWSILCCFPMRIGRELNWKWYLGLKQHSFLDAGIVGSSLICYAVTPSSVTKFHNYNRRHTGDWWGTSLKWNWLKCILQCNTASAWSFHFHVTAYSSSSTQVRQLSNFHCVIEVCAIRPMSLNTEKPSTHRTGRGGWAWSHRPSKTKSYSLGHQECRQSPWCLNIAATGTLFLGVWSNL